VIYTGTRTDIFINLQILLWQTLCGFVFVLLAGFTLYAQTTVSQTDEQTMTIDDAPEQQVISFGKTVIIKKHAKWVLAFGGDVIIEGTVDEDVGTVGGSVIQRENAQIGGDVVILGGSYRGEDKIPLRQTGKETIVIYSGFEEELRNLFQNPSQIFVPTFSWTFLTQRILSVLFWFLVSLGFTTISPGAVSRAIARFQLSTLRIFAIGFFAFVLTTLGAIAGLKLLPIYISAIVGLMAFVLLMLGYVFGRVALQVSVGKQLQKRFLPEKKHSETLAILIGVIVWTIFLSVPYLWTFALLALMSASIGLVLTARSTSVWKKA